MNFEYDIYLELITDNRNVVIAEVTLEDGSFPTKGMGVSIRHTDDKKFDPEVGYNLAVSRALASLSNRLEKRATGKTKHNDEVRVARATKETLVAARDAMVDSLTVNSVPGSVWEFVRPAKAHKKSKKKREKVNA